ncbi:hypothetical protein GC087_24960 (plasmid) [Pantoea sp. JZ2]|uniref:hypothetical protein n=1 Tax=unclassified Pantoea TaxID=2630326 RepID=UPI000D772D93|nr:MULTISPECIES: hypothetical protein [unclassified Pantoea]PXV74848.1 hypothetical protein C7433_104357 [Pantoea sp. PNA 03-3]WRH15833.1 hypothetical protein GC087_24960 [Pantoea sp. JZ2]
MVVVQRSMAELAEEVILAEALEMMEQEQRARRLEQVAAAQAHHVHSVEAVAPFAHLPQVVLEAKMVTLVMVMVLAVQVVQQE